MSRLITLPVRKHIEIRWLAALRHIYPDSNPAHLECQIHEATKSLYRCFAQQSDTWDVHGLIGLLTARPSLDELLRVFHALRMAFRQSLADSDVPTVLWLNDQLDHWIEACVRRYSTVLKSQSHTRWSETIQRVTQLNTLSHCLAELNVSLDLVSAFNATVELARLLSGADLCILYQCDGDVLRLRAVSGTALPNTVIPIDEPRLLEPVIVDQEREDIPIELVRQRLGVPDVRAMHCLPLQVNNVATGRLTIIFMTEKSLTRQEVRLQEVFAACAARAIDNAELYERLGALTAKCERRQIACEMHDTLLQTLITLNINLRVMQNHAQQGNWQEALPLVEAARQLGKAAIQECRDAVSGLRQDDDSSLECNLIEALQPEIAAFADRAAIQPKLSVHQEVYVLPHVSRQLCRLVGEALNNVHRHASANNVQIVVTLVGDQLLVQVQDDGVGFQLSKVDHQLSFGLVGMYERARLIYGTVTIDTAPNQGTTVNVICPLGREAVGNKHFPEGHADFS